MHLTMINSDMIGFHHEIDPLKRNTSSHLRITHDHNHQ